MAIIPVLMSICRQSGRKFHLTNLNKLQFIRKGIVTASLASYIIPLLKVEGNESRKKSQLCANNSNVPKGPKAQ